MNQQPNPKANAIAKAREAAEKMTAAMRLLREAQAVMNPGDFGHYAREIEELLGGDDGHSGLFHAIDAIEAHFGK